MAEVPSRKVKKPAASPKPASKASKLEAKAPVEPANRPQGLTIVGIGASAGGLGALGTFFDALPVDTGMAFVVVTHLHPEHESHMAELLQRHTAMPTMQVVKRTRVEANHVYVISPNRRILMTDTHLDTREFDEPHGRRTPIDQFFRSMAQSGHPDPIAVILSGGGTDGSVGIKDVKEVGGLIMVQDPQDAEYDSMPRAALTTGLVDVVLPAGELPKKLTNFVKHRPQLPHDAGQLSDQEVETMRRILGQVHARTGHDFSQYKRSTILRRVERRMQLNGFPTLEAYLEHLRGNANEAHAMFNDILIGVTNFFRDQESWNALAQQVIPALFQDSPNERDEGIRVWSIGCATGEEAYGLAILLFEEAAKQEGRRPIHVFASDLDERSIALAREGLYPSAIEADVSPERLERFFTREGEYYRVKRELRDVVLFTNHNVMRDPPFSRQDLIACRNVLIYLQRAVQDRVFDIFHYALKPEGYLFLGTSESAEYTPHLFNAVDKKHRIYQAKLWTGEQARVPSMPLRFQRSSPVADVHPGRPLATRFLEDPVGLGEQHHRALESYGPPSVIVNERYAILHVSETAGRYLHQPKGPITGDILTLVRPELQMELRSALFHAFEKSKAVVTRPVNVQFNGHRRRVVLSVRPRPSEPGLERIVERQALVLFIEDEIVNPDELTADLDTPRTQVERDEMLTQLQSEIQRLREQLQITVEEYESSNEEMKAANEELQSINEEYRSTTEELETSKEEFQSVNEELQTVNSEMRNKLDEISQAHRELENLMGATDIATLYLDRELRIQRFTAGVQQLFSILDVDRGRRISDLTHKLGESQFIEYAEHVLRTLLPLEREVQMPGGNWFLMLLRPYRTVDDHIEGVVITFIEITKLKEIEQELVKSAELLEERVLERTHELDAANQKIGQARDMFSSLFNADPVPTSLTRLEDDVFLNVNTEFLNYFGLKREEIIGHSAGELNIGLGLTTLARPEFIARMKEERRVSNFERKIKLASGEVRNVIVSVQYIELEGTAALISTFIDITDRVRAEQQVRALASDLTNAEQRERHRISQVLHDDLQQLLFAIKTQLMSADGMLKKQDWAGIKDMLAEADQALATSISITRNLSTEISPIILHGEGLAHALTWLAGQMEKQYGLHVVLKTNGIRTNFDNSLRVMLFQAVRELLFNVVKHSGTLKASIAMEKLNEHVRISITDEGKGFDATRVLKDTGTAHSLMSLRQRLDLMGCIMEVASQPGAGTSVFIECPLPQE